MITFIDTVVLNFRFPVCLQLYAMLCGVSNKKHSAVTCLMFLYTKWLLICKKTVAQSSFLSKVFSLKSKQSQRKWQHFWNEQTLGGGSKDDIFSCFHSSCQLGLCLQKNNFPVLSGPIQPMKPPPCLSNAVAAFWSFRFVQLSLQHHRTNEDWHWFLVSSKTEKHIWAGTIFYFPY